jgi:superfamily II DNA or RNA helicase
MSVRKDKLQQAIGEKRAALRELDRQRDAVERELEALERELSTLGSVTPRTAQSSTAEPKTPSEKVALFRSLFRGREDIYPALWTNAKTGRTGYAPTCANEWVRGVCEKPRVRCGECPNQAFIPMTEQVVLEHLQGRKVVGVYPMLREETCWFLAADFDKGDWMGDVAAFRQVSEAAGLSVAVERSRSGNGAHAWFFFDAPVPAASARRMGSLLITRTMSKRHQLDMASYDRMFPSQDTMPRGGFGNLIALPLQHEAREHGHTTFVDEAFRPYDNQWAFLAGIRRISPSTVEKLVSSAISYGGVLGVQPSTTENADLATPWALEPSHHAKPPPLELDGDMPDRVQAVLAQRLFIAKEGLSSPLLNALKRLAAFQNPEFYKKQSMRLSTALTPRIIACAEDFPEHIALPRGCTDGARDLIQSLGSTLEIDDQRTTGQPIDYRFQGTLTPLQQNAVHALLGHELGVLVAPPGMGKTVAGIHLIAERKRSTLVLVHRQPLLDQWVAQLALFLNVDPKSIGRIGGGKKQITGEIDVAMIQSLVRKDEVAGLVAGYGHVIVDECHHIPAVSFERVLAEVRARYVTGLTATPKRRDGQHPIIQMQLGPVRFVVDQKIASGERPFEHRLIVRDTPFELPAGSEDQPIQRLYQILANDEQRNTLILDDIITALDEGRSPIVLTERKSHLDFLAEHLRGFTRNLIVLKGGTSAKRRRETLAELNAIPANQERLVLATGRYIGEGFDDTRLDTLFLTMPVSWRGTVVQYTGRLHRAHPGKSEVRIYDYVDSRVPVLARMFQRRLVGYRSIGYQPDGMSPSPSLTAS